MPLCYGGHNCNGKRNNLAAKEKDSRQKKRLPAEGRTSRQKGKEARQKGKDSRQKKKPHDKRKRLTAKEKTPRLRERREAYHGIRKCSKGISVWSSLPAISAILEHLKEVGRKMFCHDCGQQVSEGVNYCLSCGKSKVFIRYYIFFNFFTDKEQSNRSLGNEEFHAFS